jgi:UDP-glucose 4-epimerase
LQSDGSPQRDFIHGDDVAGAIEVLIKSKNNNGNNIFHIASGETLTILELAQKVKEVYFQRYNNEIDIYLPDNSISEDPKKYKDIERYTIATNKINEIGFQKKINLEVGLNKLFQYSES